VVKQAMNAKAMERNLFSVEQRNSAHQEIFEEKSCAARDRRKAINRKWSKS
jgi:hypothetical protein